MVMVVVVAAETKPETQKRKAETIPVIARVAIIFIRTRTPIVVVPITVIAGIIGTVIRVIVVVVIVAMMTVGAISEVAVMMPIMSINLMMMLLLVVRYALN